MRSAVPIGIDPFNGLKLGFWPKITYRIGGAILQVSDEEVMPMEHILREIMVAVVAGVIVALISRRLK